MAYTGTVKSFSDVKGWGFIDYDGTDVFVHVKDCSDGRPQVGDQVTFDMEEDRVRQGQHKALNVAGCTGVAKGQGKGKGGGCNGGGGGSGSCNGVVKSFNDAKGWGFIDMEGTDVFLHVKDCHGSRPVVGDYVNFDVEDSARGTGQKKALNVSGCSGYADSWKGGKGGGKSNGYGPMWSGGGYGGFGGYSPYDGYGGGKGYGGYGGYSGYDGYGGGCCPATYTGKGYGKGYGKGNGKSKGW